MSTEKDTDAATEQAEVEEIRTLLRQRLLAILRGDAPVRASMLAQAVKFLAEIDQLKKPQEPTTIPGSPAALNSALATPFDLPFPVNAKLPGGRLNDDQG